MDEHIPCPDCGDAPNDPEMHAEGCPRIGTCGQCGPPWRSGPFHRYQTGRPVAGEYSLSDEAQHWATVHADG